MWKKIYRYFRLHIKMICRRFCIITPFFCFLFFLFLYAKYMKYLFMNIQKQHKVKETWFFVVQAVGRIISGRSVGKIIIIFLNLGFATPKNKEYCACEGNHISLLCDSTMPSALNICFYLFYCNRKEKYHIRRKISRKKKNMWNQY